MWILEQGIKSLVVDQFNSKHRGNFISILKYILSRIARFKKDLRRKERL